MRRFQATGTPMSSKHKAYEMVGRASLHSFGPGASKPRTIKFIAAVVATTLALYVLHAIFSPMDHVYGLMIDAGSTGSRVHTFTFERNVATGDLRVLSEDFHAIKPGLSQYKDTPKDAAQSLDSLLERAKTLVPAERRAQTPVVLRATAGLRMVGEPTAKAILTDVRKKLKSSGFRFDDDAWASILSGNEEAIYSWMTVNYLLSKKANNTVGVLEMGGGSAQVAFVPRDASMKTNNDKCGMAGETLTYAGTRLNLYTVSHLDFGLQKARSLILRKFKEADALSNNPCMNKGEEVKVDLQFSGNASVAITGRGNYGDCKKMVTNMLIKPSLGECTCDKCSYNGKAQPYAIPEYVALAFYRERTASIGMDTTMTLADIDKKGREVCTLSVDEVNRKFTDVPNGVATDLCLDLTFVSLHLQHGLGISPDGDTTLTVVDKIDGFELGWCLGAMQQTMASLYKR